MKGSVVAAAMLAVAVLATPGFGGARKDRVQVDVSKLRGTQSETTIAVDPSNPSVLLAGSNNHPSRRVAGYSSTDGGASWTAAGVPAPPTSFATGDPVVAIDRAGRQYFGYVAIFENGGRTTRLGLYVASRAGPGAPWSLPARAVENIAGAFDDKPALAVDDSASSPHAGRLYTAWSRITVSADTAAAAVYLAHSDDAGATWSTPAIVSDRRLPSDSYPSIDVGRDGTVYVGFWDWAGRGIYIDASHDGGDTFGRDVLVDPIHGRSGCQPAGVSIPAQPANCVRPNPIVAVDNSAGPFAGRVYVSYGDTGARRRTEQDVFAAAFDPALHLVFRRHQLGRPDGARRSDQFWPASAVDASTGIVWACFYDTRGDRRLRHAWYSCTRSRNGGAKWTAPVRAATTPSSERVRGADSLHGRLKREYGDYEGLVVAAGVAHPVWTDTRRLRTLREEVFTTTLSDASFPR